MKKLFVAASAAATCALAFAIAGCNGGGNGSSSTILGSILTPTFRTARQADLTGQTSVYQGDLGNGVTFTFPAVQNATYIVTANVAGSSSPDDLTLDVFSRDGSELKGKSFQSNGNVAYHHDAVSQHVLCLLRPSSVFDSFKITSLTVQGQGSFSTTTLSINIIVAGDDFGGFGNFNDLQSAQDRQNLAAALAQRVQALHDANNTAIKVSFQGFTLSNAQVSASHPELLDASGHTICHPQPEQVNSQGFSNIDTADLDRWGDFGFPANDPNTQAANGLDVFVIHHFATDGVVGLSPRPGTAIKGNGPGTALCVGAFLQQGGQIAGPRDLDNMGVVMTHEIGHFLGLLHTTTFSPDANVTDAKEAIDDGLDDTPAAGDLATLKSNATANGHAAIGVGDGCADEPNIMFYQSEPSQQQLSPKQIAIMKTTLSLLEH